MGFNDNLRALRGFIATAGSFLWWPFRRPKAEQLFRFLCPYCDRKLRFPRHMAGRWTTCPACKHHFTLPAVPAENSA
jgi:ribosomal protein L37AE/L43A